MDTTSAKPIESYDELVAALRRRVDELGIVYDAIDSIAGLAPRYAAKLLCQPPMKHVSTPLLFSILDSLGLRMRLEADDRAIEVLRQRSDWFLLTRPGRRWRPRKRKAQRR